MTWEEYYEKIWEWQPSTMVKHMSKLSSFGPSEEVMEAIIEISFGDTNGATRMLKKPIDAGIIFNGDQLSNMYGNCDESELERALRLSADQFTAQDIDDLYGVYEDELLIEIALKHNIVLPEELAEEKEELLIPDANTPIDWERFYNNYDNWSEDYAKARFGALSSFGDEDELIEVISCLFGDDEASASKYIRKILNQGITFAGDNLIEITSMCDDETVRKAVLAAQHRLDDEILEELYGVVEDSLIRQVARKNGLKLPECMREDDAWCVSEQLAREDSKLSKAELSEAYDYVMQCLRNAHEKMVLAYRLSISDVSSDKRSISIVKHACLLEAEPFVDEARLTLEGIESQVQDKISVQNTRLNMGKWIVFHDVYGDGFLTDWMVQRRIKKMLQAVEKTHKEVLKLKSKL